MKNAVAVLGFVTLSAAVFAQDPPPAPNPSPKSPAAEAVKRATGPDLGEAAAGEVIYMRYCAACHGKTLKGDGPVASGLNKKPIDLTELSKKNDGTFPFDKVAAMIDGRQSTRMHGTPDMPVWGEVFATSKGADAPGAESSVKRIANYVWTLQTK